MAVRLSASMRKLKKRFERHASGIKSAWRDSGIIAREQRTSRVAMLAEAAALAVRGRMAVDTYFSYRLFDPALTAHAKRRYLSEAPKANEQLWATLTPPKYGCLYDNKIIFHRFFTSAEGVRGHLTFIFTGPVPDRPGTYEMLDGQRYDAAALVAASRRTGALEVQAPAANVGAFLVEERIRPHAELAELIGPTLCTARVLTIVARDGSPRIVGAVFKVQPRPVGVD